MTISGIILSVCWYIFDGHKKAKLQDVGLYILVTLFHIVIPFSCEYIGLQSISPSSACLMYNGSPFISALLSYIFFDEKMTKKKWFGFSISMLAIFFYTQSGIQGVDFVITMADVLILISVVTGCFGWILIKMLVKQKEYSVLFVNGMSMLLGGPITYGLSWLAQEQVMIAPDNLLYFFSLLMSIILIANIIFYNLYSFLLKKYTATFLSFAGFITPLWAAGFEWIFFGSCVSLNFFITVGIVGFGIYIFYQEDLRQGYIA